MTELLTHRPDEQTERQWLIDGIQTGKIRQHTGALIMQLLDFMQNGEEDKLPDSDQFPLQQ